MNLDIMLDFANKASDIIANKIVPNTDIIMVVLLIVCGLYYSFFNSLCSVSYVEFCI